MCIAPNTLEDGTMTSCRKCWQCRQRRIDDWVGRNIAESITALATHVVTLTYGPNWRMWENTFGQEDHARAKLLTYSDVQKFLKRLKWHGEDARYFVTGEYGSEKRRAHWHIILYWQKTVPTGMPMRENWTWERWIDGHTYWDKAKAGAIRYACKYVLKEPEDGEAQGMLMMSKKPPLGAEYFRRLALSYVEQRLAPQDPFYTFKGVTRRVKGGTRKEPIQFVLTGNSLKRYRDAYIDQWREHYGDEPWPPSDFIDEGWEERGRKIEMLDLQGSPPRGGNPLSNGAMWRDVDAAINPGWYSQVRREWMRKDRIWYDEIRNAWYHEPYKGMTRFVVGQAVNIRWYFIRQKDGTDRWQSEVGERGYPLSDMTQAEYEATKRPE